MEKKKKIVMIDDNRDFLFTVGTFLERNGYIVATADEAEAGLKLVKQEAPDLILLDVMMEMLFSGFEIYRQLRIDPDLKDIPIIGISGIADEINVKYDGSSDNEYFNPEEFLEKPVDNELLLKKVEKVLGITKP
ncbi:MAG: response regulator [Desulfobacterales bacterium]|jgi:CheY-like chemotaxis protein|nr:response regulator [Desulfobacteraceae bacterium]MBT4362866.1 response regulator [Desulfobacteraceae bacterium]MBT7086722.1 response regulator [Desulfobacterales bacterium]MBT7696550.1 response regulator [Desulfobacterales bacterium]